MCARALCYLKLGQFEEAKLDCDQALQIDGENVKASHRLALAQKGLEVRVYLSVCLYEILSPNATSGFMNVNVRVLVSEWFDSWDTLTCSAASAWL